MALDLFICWLSLIEDRSMVLATKSESGVWLDVGKAAEPQWQVDSGL